jgi:hypothetical protein
MPCQVTLMFQQSQVIRTPGWSETYYTNDNNLGACASAEQLNNSWLNRRLNLLGAGAVCSYVRIALVLAGPPAPGGGRRSVEIINGPPAQPGSGSGPVYNPDLIGSPADFAGTVYMNRAATDPAGTPVYARSLWFRGIPDNIDTTVSGGPLAGPWLNAYSLFQAIATNAVASRYVLRVNDHGPGNPSKLCTDQVGGPTQYTVPAHGFLQGQIVVANAFRAGPGGVVPKGQYKVNVINAQTISLQNGKPTSNVTALGSFRLLSYAFPLLNNLLGRGFTIKKAGRPFGQLVGRRRTPRSSRA